MACIASAVPFTNRARPAISPAPPIGAVPRHGTLKPASHHGPVGLRRGAIVRPGATWRGRAGGRALN
jgi:hypothetical protein